MSSGTRRGIGEHSLLQAFSQNSSQKEFGPKLGINVAEEEYETTWQWKLCISSDVRKGLQTMSSLQQVATSLRRSRSIYLKPLVEVVFRFRVEALRPPLDSTCALSCPTYVSQRLTRLNDTRIMWALDSDTHPTFQDHQSTTKLFKNQVPIVVRREQRIAFTFSLSNKNNL